MGDTIFRKESVDRLRSPEQLNEYIRVAAPGIWLVLAAVVLLLLGVIAWGVFGTVESTVEAGVLADGGAAVCYVGESDADRLAAGMEVSVGRMLGTVKSVSTQPAAVSDASLLRLGGLSEGEPCYAVELEIDGLADGIYSCEIVVERISPITFVIQ